MLSFEIIWVDLESIRLSEISQTKQDKNNMLFYIWVIKQKAANMQNKETHKHRQQYGGYQRKGGLRRMKRVKGGHIYGD